MAVDRHPGDIRAHALAQRRYFAENGDWGYDPGEAAHITAYFEPALRIVQHIDDARYLTLAWNGPEPYGDALPLEETR